MCWCQARILKPLFGWARLREAWRSPEKWFLVMGRNEIVRFPQRFLLPGESTDDFAPVTSSRLGESATYGSEVRDRVVQADMSGAATEVADEVYRFHIGKLE